MRKVGGRLQIQARLFLALYLGLGSFLEGLVGGGFQPGGLTDISRGETPPETRPKTRYRPGRGGGNIMPDNARASPRPSRGAQDSGRRSSGGVYPRLISGTPSAFGLHAGLAALDLNDDLLRFGRWNPFTSFTVAWLRLTAIGQRAGSGTLANCPRAGPYGLTAELLALWYALIPFGSIQAESRQPRLLRRLASARQMD